MKASSVSSRSATALVALLIAGAALVAVREARADDGRVVLSTGIGAVAGALIGQSIGGRNATIVGGALGAAIGASAATQGGHNRDRAGYQGGYYAPAAPVVYTPPVQVYRPVPVYQPVYRPIVRPVIYPVAYHGGYSRGHSGYYDSDERRHHGRGWDNNRRDDRHGGGDDRGDRGNRGGWDSDRGNYGHRR